MRRELKMESSSMKIGGKDKGGMIPRPLLLSAFDCFQYVLSCAVVSGRHCILEVAEAWERG